MSVSSAPRTSQLSGSTVFNSNSSLESLGSAVTMVAPMNGQVVANNNIINQTADASRSLYQKCMALQRRLSLVPGFEGYMQELEEMTSNPDLGPVGALWKLLRTGLPLLAIYNALQPPVPLSIDVRPGDSDAKKAKIAIMKFVTECKGILSTSECFIVNDVLGEDTTGFVKVTSAISRVLDAAAARGLLRTDQPFPEADSRTQPGLQMSMRDYIVRELVETERKYVQDLENLHDLKRTLEQKGAIPGDDVHQIFLNISTILDFQRRFLIRVETTNSMPPEKQEWGAPFVSFEESFTENYLPFIANQRKAQQLAQMVFDKIQAANHPVAVDYNTLDGFLLKPMQRLVKYPLLLKDLGKKSEDPKIQADLAAGKAAAERVLGNANDAVDRDLLDEALEDLVGRVDDWKNHRVEQFGKLLLHGVYTVVTGKSDQPKDYEIYLFEAILLCCKEIAPKTKDKKDKTKSTGPKIRNRHAKLQLKGRIFMTNVTDVVAISKTGSYTVQIWWRGDPGVENFMIRFQNEEVMKKWAAGLDRQRKDSVPSTQQSPDQLSTNFTWMTSQTSGMENPYAQQEDEDDEDSYATPTPANYAVAPPALPGSMQRNASNSSLRQRSTVNDGGPSLRGPAPPRFPLPQPLAPLSLATSSVPPPHPSPGLRGAESYFSPTTDSPASSRASATSGMFPPTSAGYQFPPMVGTHQQGWEDPHNRYTAPAMGRAPSRDGSSPAPYGANGRNPRGPSMPLMPRDAQMQQQRSRSYSTPDINGQPNGRRSNSAVPAMPSIPPHLAHDIPRSSSGSPAIDLPMRSNTQSPGAALRRQYSQGMSAHSRQGTPVNGGLGGMVAPPGPPPPGMAPLAPVDRSRSITPALGTAPLPQGYSGHMTLPTPDLPVPTQLKVKVNCGDGNYITLVASYNTTYQSLIDRIDNKLRNFSGLGIVKDGLKLQYKDEDDDLVRIESDDDIQIAISEWREGASSQYPVAGGVGEIELFLSNSHGGGIMSH